MGEYVSWHCSKCGEGESFSLGGGMLGFNNPEVLERAEKGELGPAMETLLANGVPEGWTLFNENAFYLCPSCEAVIPGGTVRIDDGSGNWLVFHEAPDACPSCGEELCFWDDKVPMSFGELRARCVKRSEGACPKCGAEAVELGFGSWD